MPEGLQYATLQAVRLIAEAQERAYFYYKSHVGRPPNYILTLYFSDAHGDKYSRTMNLRPIFSRAGSSYTRLHATQIQTHMDSTILAADSMHRHEVGKVGRIGTSPSNTKGEPYPF
jgi:hypothetical protein